MDNASIGNGSGGGGSNSVAQQKISPKQKLEEDVQQQIESNKVDDFKLVGRLGDGAYSQVYKVKRIADNQVYALKKVRLNNLSEKEKENAINEVRILASIKHKNVISYKEAFIEPNTQSLCIVMEYADDGDLFQRICDHQQDSTQMAESDVWLIFIQIVRGLRAMHDLNIMHRDLKSANVFLNKDFTIKLGDMNVSKVVSQRNLSYTQTGTPYYASPEVWKDEPYDFKSDIWSLGCVLYEMICLKPPFQANDMSGLYKRVVRGQFPKIPKSYSSDLWNIVQQMLQVNPQQRPDARQVMSMASFQKRSLDLFPETPDVDQSELLKTIRIPKNLMYLSNRLPMANYDFKTKKNQTVKLSRSINNGSRHPRQSLVQDIAQRIQRHSIDETLQPQTGVKLPNVQKLPGGQHSKNISLIGVNDHQRNSIQETSAGVHQMQHNIGHTNQSLPKISSKAKLAALEQQSTMDYSEQKYTKGGNQSPSIGVYSPIKNQKVLNEKIGSILPTPLNNRSPAPAQKQAHSKLSMNAYSESVNESAYVSKEIIAQSATLVNRSPTMSIDDNLSTSANNNVGNTGQNSIQIGEAVRGSKNRHDYSTNISNSIIILSRDPSLKKLKREKSISEASNLISQIVNSSVAAQQIQQLRYLQRGGPNQSSQIKIAQQKLQDVYKPQLSRQQAAVFNPQIISVNQSLEKRSLKPTRTLDNQQQQPTLSLNKNQGPNYAESFVKNRQNHHYQQKEQLFSNYGDPETLPSRNYILGSQSQDHAANNIHKNSLPVQRSKNNQIFHNGNNLSQIQTNNGNNQGSVMGIIGARHNQRKSVAHEERVKKVASVYAVDSLSPVLKRQVQNYQKVRELSGVGAPANHRSSQVSISLNNVKLPQLYNKYQVESSSGNQYAYQQQYSADLQLDGVMIGNGSHQPVFQPYEQQQQYSQQVIKKNHAQISRNYIKEHLTNPQPQFDSTPYIQAIEKGQNNKKVYLISSSSQDLQQQSQLHAKKRSIAMQQPNFREGGVPQPTLNQNNLIATNNILIEGIQQQQNQNSIGKSGSLLSSSGMQGITSKKGTLLQVSLKQVDEGFVGGSSTSTNNGALLSTTDDPHTTNNYTIPEVNSEQTIVSQNVNIQPVISAHIKQ